MMAQALSCHNAMSPASAPKDRTITDGHFFLMNKSVFVSAVKDDKGT